MKKLILFFLFVSTGISQSYPDWFLNPDKIDCNELAVGYAIHGYYMDSLFTNAIQNSFENYVKNKECVIKGSQLFHATEIGTFWIGSDIKIQFDSSQVNRNSKKLVYKEHFNSGHSTIVLAAPVSFKLKKTEKKAIDVTTIGRPSWINSLPVSTNSLYAIGQAPSYYYESSSWLEAENTARINLAKQVAVTIKTLQKKDNFEGQEIRSEEISVRLRDIKIAARWVDVMNNIFYVLVKTNNYEMVK